MTQTPAEPVRPPEELLSPGGTVLLRRKRVSDVGELTRLVTDAEEHLTPWLPWAAGYDAVAATAHLEECERAWAQGSMFDYTVTARGVPVGGASLMARIGGGGREIGYWVHPDWTGRGVASESARALALAAFALPGVEFVEIRHDRANLASAAVPRRLGFARVWEGTPPPGRPHCPGEEGVLVVWRMNRPQ